MRPKRARFFERYIFFFLVFSRGGDDDEEGATKPKTKISAKEKRKTNFFLKERENEKTQDSTKNFAHFSSARFCLNEKQTEKENAATKMMVRAMRAGRFDFQERIIDFFFEEVRLVFLFFLFWKEEREREKEKSSREDKKKSRSE